ncbi:MAG: hypothetical protein NT040_10320 [Bacteroidetes bacterium]|nr:hypothetical protein [Bacteroidota bacterium]
MKKYFISLILFLLAGMISYAQVGINSDGSAPDPSAMLDVRSTSKGMLVPRMTIAERNDISSPASGLLVFCTDNNQYFSNKGTPAVPNWVMISSQWLNSGNNIYFNSGNVGIGVSSPTTISLQVNGKIGASYGTTTAPGFTFDNGIENTGFSSPAANSISFITQATEKMRLNQAGALGIGTESPDAASLVDITSTTKGFLPPRMTFEQRNAIVSPAEGLMVFCTNCNSDGSGVVSFFENGYWRSVSLTCLKPVSPQAGSHVQSNTQIIWNWSAVPIADGYKWHTSNNFAAATNMGTATSKTETGLAQGTSYTRYVWAYNACGSSDPVVMQGQALVCGSSFTRTHSAGTTAPVAKTVTYGTVTNIPGETTKCWITRNLGATQQPITVNDATEASAGWCWQFNLKQGYKHDGTTRTPNSTWITAIVEDSDWVSANDPCSLLLGGTWRIPSSTEWTNVDAAGNWIDWNGPFNSGLKMHAAGFLGTQDGSLFSRGINGNYWSNAQTNANSGRALGLGSNSSFIGGSSLKANGYTLRCLRD